MRSDGFIDLRRAPGSWEETAHWLTPEAVHPSPPPSGERMQKKQRETQHSPFANFGLPGLYTEMGAISIKPILQQHIILTRQSSHLASPQQGNKAMSHGEK